MPQTFCGDNSSGHQNIRADSSDSSGSDAGTRSVMQSKRRRRHLVLLILPSRLERRYYPDTRLDVDAILNADYYMVNFW
ncbi:hypothetical protein M427DRAFT_51699 [Gonapodya prolifera JEL478]|uniref:Uncharacterized protein n=1 Tax=Gonapodya prolifera (strain JEL478) TaxID=1344416 RepID=A0A139AVJ0_GONPJ|nr:hypothetical protein M427DRAFT_51699 [Gonapodya prolifera JEL478]|eukprot:KXS20719.1 hypothetical protein M427DRAFT_51699 [Gonapodya prolifera JEL478]